MLKSIDVGDYTLKNLTLAEKARLLTGGGYWTSASLKDKNIPAIRFSDGPAGVRPQGDKGDNLGKNKSLKATCFPSHSALACSWNTALIGGVGARVGAEARYFGVDVMLAPDINVKRDPLCGRNFEYFSEDPYFNGKAGSAYANGVASEGAAACLKHFAANNREFARMVCNSVIDERTLREIYLTGFEIAVKESKPAAVMTAYNKVNGVYCNQSEKLIRDILRGEWGFDGLVISDWGGTDDRVLAVKAGADLEMPPCRFSAEEIIRAVENGELQESAVDECAERVINLALREKVNAQCDFAEHADYGKKCAAECVVLLKNDGSLPLNDGFALIGDIAVNPVYQGGGSSKVNAFETLGLYGCLKDKICGFERGYKKSGQSKRLANRALKLCEKTDTVVFCAGLYDGDTEGSDRDNARLPQNQLNLLKRICASGKRVIVVLFCGCAVDTGWDERVNALVYAGLAGQNGSSAVADILTGKINPSGKLTESFFAEYNERKKDPYFEIYGEGMNVGYRSSRAVKYPFGHGLSYTKFDYSDLSVNESGVAFTVTNSGKIYGGEVAQLYVRYPDNAGFTALQLKGFEKVFLGAGESRRVNIPFDEYTFRSYDTVGGGWAVVSGEYEICICSSSADVRLKGSIIKNGIKEVAPCRTAELTCSPYPVKKNKRGRVIADLRTPLYELRNAKGVIGRLFSRLTLFLVRKNKTVYGSMQYLPLRTMAQFGKMKKGTINALISAFNGFSKK